MPGWAGHFTCSVPLFQRDPLHGQKGAEFLMDVYSLQVVSREIICSKINIIFTTLYTVKEVDVEEGRPSLELAHCQK